MEKKINARKKAQRAARLRKQRNRRIALTLALMFVVAFASIGGTIAWLTAQTSEVKNTFTAGNIAITLNEGDVYEKDETIPEGGKLGKFKDNGATRVNANEYQAIPGNTYDKDPKVTVVGGSEECYLFVKFEKGSAATYYTYESTLTTDNGWTQGTGDNGNGVPTNVWFRTVEASNGDQSWYLLKDNQITVNSSAVTAGTMTSATAVELKWTAYACQTANVASAAAAWEILNPTTTA